MSDRVIALYAPIGLLLLSLVWLALVLLGYAGIYLGLGVDTWEQAILLSGSSLLTLGFVSGENVPLALLNFSEGAIGLLLLALLISYLPTMYATFSRRETAVTLLDVRAGSPPSAIEMLERYHRLGRLDRLNDLWITWESWFAELEESHTSLAAWVFFRSPNPARAWVTASGAVLDAALAHRLDPRRPAQRPGRPVHPSRIPGLARDRRPVPHPIRFEPKARCSYQHHSRRVPGRVRSPGRQRTTFETRL